MTANFQILAVLPLGLAQSKPIPREGSIHVNPYRRQATLDLNPVKRGIDVDDSNPFTWSVGQNFGAFLIVN